MNVEMSFSWSLIVEVFSVNYAEL